VKYSDLIGDWLVELGYTTCFFVAGGNIMHSLESFRHRFSMRSPVHEVCAGIAAEYFNEVSEFGKAFALVTAGPGVTNILTALAGAYLESRELLVIAGQVKTPDLSRGKVRQRGIQEIDGVALASPVSVAACRMDAPAPRHEWQRLVSLTRTGRRGPVFIELPLDVQAMPVERRPLENTNFTASASAAPSLPDETIGAIAEGLRRARRPVILIGGGVDRSTARSLRSRLTEIEVPLLTTWNGADRIPENHPLYFGRPNTWGQRSSNLILQQSDELLVLGSRLGLQQTGFNWQQFAPGARVTQVELDRAELEKSHPRVEVPLLADANETFHRLCQLDLGDHPDWVNYCRRIRQALPLVESINHTSQGYISPYVFVTELSELCGTDDLIIPCSSGSAFTVTQQAFRLKESQLMVSNKGLAAMGYGLSGAIGAALAHPKRRTVLFEGDGGFAQNLQEIGTAVVNQLNLKIFIFDDGGYASIRMTQKNYFKGSYVGCDTKTGLGMPNWTHIFEAYDVPSVAVGPGFSRNESFKKLFGSHGVAAFLVRIDPEQTYFPKITSRVAANGGMVSEPLHRMSPPLDSTILGELGVYLPPDV
jgi:acetolactate synthase-1/2/3 large subunit